MEDGKIVKTFKSKKGNKVVFRYPKPEDLEDCLTFANKIIAEDTFVDLSGRKKTLKDEKKYLNELLKQVKKGEKIHLVVIVNGKYAGNGEVRIGKLRRSHAGDIGIALAKEYRNEGIGTRLLKALIDEAKAYKLRLIRLNCFENNTHACHVYEKLGFVKAGIIPNAIKWKDGYVGEVKFYLPL